MNESVREKYELEFFVNFTVYIMVYNTKETVKKQFNSLTPTPSFVCQNTTC